MSFNAAKLLAYKRRVPIFGAKARRGAREREAELIIERRLGAAFQNGPSSWPLIFHEWRFRLLDINLTTTTIGVPAEGSVWPVHEPISLKSTQTAGHERRAPRDAN